MKICPSCNEKFESGKFCKYCGTALQDEAQELFCTECGTKLSQGAQFCSECGAKVIHTVKKVTQSLYDTDFVNIPNRNFKMMKMQVSQKLYQDIMGTNPSIFVDANNPVENVSWYNAIDFCNKLSMKNGRKPVYSVTGQNVSQDIFANGFRLPTLDEWQYAVKGGQSYTYAGGYNLAGQGWYRDNSDQHTHPVGQKTPNAYGLYDMSGNVWEWTWGSQSGNGRYACGGCWSDHGDLCTISSKRLFDAVDMSCLNDDSYTDFSIGFRVVCNKE